MIAIPCDYFLIAWFLLPIGSKPEGAIGNSWFVCSTTQGKPAFRGISKAKRNLDAEIAKRRAGSLCRSVDPHDLRRTARSLMSRAKIPVDHAERALGHVIGGVREACNRYECLEEKRNAFKTWHG